MPSLLHLPKDLPLLRAIPPRRALPGARRCRQHGEEEGKGRKKREEGKGKRERKKEKRGGGREKEKRGKGRVTRAPKRFTHGEEKQRGGERSEPSPPQGNPPEAWSEAEAKSEPAET